MSLLLCYNPGMATLDSIPLTQVWRVYPPQEVDPTYGSSQLDESSWDCIPALADWPRHLLAREGMIYLRRTFDLEPIEDVCLRFILHVETAPEGTAVYINGWHAGTVQAGAALVSDVTDYVTLEDNVLLLKVSRRGEFGGLWLQPLPCDAAH